MELEQLTLFRLKFQKDITVVNRRNQRIPIPTPTRHFAQCEIGDMPTSKIKKRDICPMALAPGHPVIDADWQSDLHVFYIQISFSKYRNHKKKRTDLYSTPITCGSNKNVHGFYDAKIRKFAKDGPKKEYFVYATTEFNHKCCDNKVFFMDLQNTMLNLL